MRRSPWIRSPAWDGFWTLNGLWLVPIVLWLARADGDGQATGVDVLYFGASALFWIGHRVCSTYLAYCTEAYRPLLRAQPVRFVVVPLLVTAACFAAFLPPDDALPWSRGERIVGFAIVDYLFVTYHFAAQHFGALSLYRMRAGRARRGRAMDRLFALGVGGVLVFVADVLAGAVAYQDRWIDRLAVVDALVPAEDAIRAGATIALLVVTAAMLVTELRGPSSSLPRVLYVSSVAMMVAVALRTSVPFLFVVVWTSQHWILAIGLASRTAGAEPVPVDLGVRRALHAVNLRPWAVVLVLVATSVVLLPLFEVEANRDGGTYYAERLFGAVAVAVRTSSWAPVLLALGFATGFVHYLLDRAVYRFSDTRVRAAARGLLADDAREGPARRTADAIPLDTVTSAAA